MAVVAFFCAGAVAAAATPQLPLPESPTVEDRFHEDETLLSSVRFNAGTTSVTIVGKRVTFDARLSPPPAQLTVVAESVVLGDPGVERLIVLAASCQVPDFATIARLAIFRRPQMSLFCGSLDATGSTSLGVSKLWKGTIKSSVSRGIQQRGVTSLTKIIEYRSKMTGPASWKSYLGKLKSVLDSALPSRPSPELEVAVASWQKQVAENLAEACTSGLEDLWGEPEGVTRVFRLLLHTKLDDLSFLLLNEPRDDSALVVSKDLVREISLHPELRPFASEWTVRNLRHFLDSTLEADQRGDRVALIGALRNYRKANLFPVIDSQQPEASSLRRLLNEKTGQISDIVTSRLINMRGAAGPAVRVFFLGDSLAGMVAPTGFLVEPSLASGHSYLGSIRLTTTPEVRTVVEFSGRFFVDPGIAAALDAELEGTGEHLAGLVSGLPKLDVRLRTPGIESSVCRLAMPNLNCSLQLEPSRAAATLNSLARSPGIPATVEFSGSPRSPDGQLEQVPIYLNLTRENRDLAESRPGTIVNMCESELAIDYVKAGGEYATLLSTVKAGGRLAIPSELAGKAVAVPREAVRRVDADAVVKLLRLVNNSDLVEEIQIENHLVATDTARSRALRSLVVDVQYEALDAVGSILITDKREGLRFTPKDSDGSRKSLNFYRGVAVGRRVKISGIAQYVGLLGSDQEAIVGDLPVSLTTESLLIRIDDTAVKIPLREQSKSLAPEASAASLPFHLEK